MPRADVYRPSRLDRDPDAILRLRGLVWGALVGVATTALLIGASFVEPGGSGVIVRAVLGGVVAGVGMTWLLRLASDGAGATFLAFVHPTGRSCPSLPEHSRLDALAAGGEVSLALAGYEDAMRAAPLDAGVRLRAAELYARANDPRRAESLFREVQVLGARTAAEDVYASNRLLDLYLGPLGERGRALRELRRMVDRYPTSAAGEGAREGIRRLKAAAPPHP